MTHSYDHPGKSLKRQIVKTFINNKTIFQPLSPAYLSGIEASDLLISFDDITASNFGGLPQLAAKMAEKENKTISLYVKRDEEIKMIKFEPKKWDGKGLLGATLKTL